jgi:thiol-disulfide isomerase/thioredoxin
VKAAIVAVLSLAGCATCGESEHEHETVHETDRAPDHPPDLRADVVGLWRGVLGSPGGELPFFVEIHPPLADPPAEIRNADERVALSGVTLEGSEVVLAMDIYAADLRATVDSDGTLRGRYRRENRDGQSELPFEATRSDGSTPRFAEAVAEPGSDSITDVSGVWRVGFTDEDGAFPARGELRQEGRRVTGTFLTETGDYRYLDGDFHRGVLRLSTFDGSHAYLFVARATDDGRLTGDFWSRDSYHASFDASRHEPGDPDILADPFAEVRVVSADQKLRFDFTSPDGEPVAMPSPRLDGHVVIVSIFGTWCPNCNDEAPVLSRFDARHRERGLRIVGLAFEHTADAREAATRIARFRDRHHITYPIAHAGRSVKAETSAALPDLSEIRSYPTTIFVGRDGRVRRIHSGFAGPATGAHHDALVAEMQDIVENLLSEGETGRSEGP